MEKAAEEMASKCSSETDGRILGRATSTLGIDESLAFLCDHPWLQRKPSEGSREESPSDCLTHLDIFWLYVV
jgi:hypothetical protein